MARSHSAANLRGTIGGYTFVKSRVYGDHVRARRGTYKRAEVNDAFKKESTLLLRANIPAKILKDAIEPYRRNLSGGMLWQRLVSMFREQLKTKGSFDFASLEPFEIHKDYPFDRFLQVASAIKPDKKKNKLRVDINYPRHPTFKKVKDVDGYRLTVIGIFPDQKKKTAWTASVESELIELTSAIAPMAAQLDVPKNAKSYIVCIRIEGYFGRTACKMRTTTGLRVVGAGRL